MTDNLRGILAVLAASTAFVLNDAIVKLLSADLPSGEIIVVRGIIATILLVAGCFFMGAMRPLRTLLTPMMLLRLATSAAATCFIVMSLRHLPLATVTTVLQVTPLAVTAGAAIVYGEKVGWRRWSTALAGFTGVVLIVRPGSSVFGAAAYLALTTLLFTTTRDLTTRGIDRSIPSMYVAAASSAAIMASGFLVAAFDAPWTIPSSRALALMTVSGVCLFFANTLIIMALRTGEIAVVAPFRYAPVPLAILLGYLWWEDIPDNLAFAGIGLVIAAGLYMLHSERSTLRTIRPVINRSPAE